MTFANYWCDPCLLTGARQYRGIARSAPRRRHAPPPASVPADREYRSSHPRHRPGGEIASAIDEGQGRNECRPASSASDECAGYLLVGRAGSHRGGDVDEFVVVERKAEMLRQGLAIVVDPGKNAASDATVAIADRQAPVEQGGSAAAWARAGGGAVGGGKARRRPGRARATIRLA